MPATIIANMSICGKRPIYATWLGRQGTLCIYQDNLSFGTNKTYTNFKKEATGAIMRMIR